MPTPLHIQSTTRVQHYGFLREERRAKKPVEEEDLGVLSSEDEEEVEEKNEGVMEVTAASVGAMKVAVLDEQECVSFLIQCFYLNTKLNRFEPWVEPTSILASVQMSEE